MYCTAKNMVKTVNPQVSARVLPLKYQSSIYMFKTRPYIKTPLSLFLIEMFSWHPVRFRWKPVACLLSIRLGLNFSIPQTQHVIWYFVSFSLCSLTSAHWWIGGVKPTLSFGINQMSVQHKSPLESGFLTLHGCWVPTGHVERTKSITSSSHDEKQHLERESKSKICGWIIYQNIFIFLNNNTICHRKITEGFKTGLAQVFFYVSSFWNNKCSINQTSQEEKEHYYILQIILIMRTRHRKQNPDAIKSHIPKSLCKRVKNYNYC